MFKKVALKIKTYFTRKKTAISIASKKAPKNNLVDFIAANVVFVCVHTLLFPEFGIIDTIVLSLMLSLAISQKGRYYVKNLPQLANS